MPEQARDALTAGELADRLDRASATIDEIRACLEADAARAETREPAKGVPALNAPHRRALRPA